MDVKISKEVAYYLSEAKRLRKLLRETQKCFDDINAGGSIVRAELSPEDEFINDITKKSPCIVIFGSSNPAKATVVNAIFGKPILPVIWNDTGYKPWRTVRFKNGNKTSASLSVHGNYELVDNLVGQHGNWNTVPTEDLQIASEQQAKGMDLANACAVLEIKMRNAFLREGGQLVITQALDGHESLEEVYSKSTKGVLPLFIYAVDQPIFSQQEVNILKELRVIDSSISIFFVRVDGPRDAEASVIDNPSSPLDKIRDTLHRNQISSDFSKDQRQSYGLNASKSTKDRLDSLQKRQSTENIIDDLKRKNSADELQSSSIRISRYLPCSLHKKAQCPDCIMSDSVDTSLQSPNQGGRSLTVLQASDSENEQDLADEGEDDNYNSMETQVSADKPSIPSPSSTKCNSPEKRTSAPTETKSLPNPPMKRKTDSNVSLAGDDVHRDFALSLFQQLLDCNYLNLLPPARQLSVISDSGSYEIRDSELAENFDQIKNLVQFIHQQLQKALINTVSVLNVVHSRCLHSFILTAFDMARDMQVTPRKLEFARNKEKELYQCLMLISDKKQDEIKDMIAETVTFMRSSLLQRAEEYDFIGVEMPESGELQSARDLKVCTGQIQQLVLEHLNSSIATKLLNSMHILKDSYTGVLARCLESLEKSESPSPESVRATMALQEILNSAYQVEITVSAGSSLLRMLYEKMKQLMYAMKWKNLACVDREWKRKVATEMLDTIDENRLARSICAQIRERLKQSHEQFEAALRHLQQMHCGRLERTEEQRLKVRKLHAPRVARLALESISMKDYIVNGMPHLGPEVGRGQYGVVYSCDKWAGRGPCAIKSVVPPDDKHWNDLALEFYYTKNVPEHERVVALRGSVIDYTYGGGASPAVLLIMDRLQRDLYAAIKGGLDWLGRLQVAIDVVEGIRFLHSQGLVHRDIKLKNVLLDKRNRGLVTDLGFCKPEAMMSGSIVGTPIHMAPELFSGRYDNSVDTYAFGILFWYVCAGHVRLPLAFEQCTNKEMLWTSVKRGVRPEKLSSFDPECWALMQSSWAGDPEKRPHLGDVQPQLSRIYQRFHTDPAYSANRSAPRRKSKNRATHLHAPNIRDVPSN